jgi:hypothetical protein
MAGNKGDEAFKYLWFYGLVLVSVWGRVFFMVSRFAFYEIGTSTYGKGGNAFKHLAPARMEVNLERRDGSYWSLNKVLLI